MLIRWIEIEVSIMSSDVILFVFEHGLKEVIGGEQVPLR